MGTTTLNEVRSLRGSKHSGVTALNKKEKNETRRKGEDEVGRHFPFAVRLLSTSLRSVLLTCKVRATPVGRSY
jgi:hypothetical protein